MGRGVRTAGSAGERHLAWRDPPPHRGRAAEPHPGEAHDEGDTGRRSRSSPDAIARAAVWLAGDEASFVHGSVVDVDGGRVGAAVIAV